MKKDLTLFFLQLYVFVSSLVLSIIYFCQGKTLTGVLSVINTILAAILCCIFFGNYRKEKKKT